jgi:hypothetical protein
MVPGQTARHLWVLPDGGGVLNGRHDMDEVAQEPRMAALRPEDLAERLGDQHIALRRTGGTAHSSEKTRCGASPLTPQVRTV